MILQEDWFSGGQRIDTKKLKNCNSKRSAYIHISYHWIRKIESDVHSDFSSKNDYENT